MVFPLPHSDVDRHQGGDAPVVLCKSEEPHDGQVEWTLRFPKPINQPTRFVDELSEILEAQDVYRNGLGGRNSGTELYFYVPEEMESEPLQTAIFDFLRKWDLKPLVNSEALTA